MFGRRQYRRKSNPIFGLFRLLLSLLIFALLLGGVYSAYKQFSGVDPVKLSPKAVIANFTSPEKIAETLFGLLSMDFKKNTEKVQGKVSGQSTQIIPVDQNQSQVNQRPQPKPAIAFKFMLVADSHSENDLLAKALKQAKEAKAQFVIGLGDYTDVGTVGELQNAKKEFDKAGLRYFVTSGDHDLWDSRNRGLAPTADIAQVFGPTYQAFSFGNAKFIILDNSDNYSGFGEAQLKFLNDELTKTRIQSDINVIFVLMHEPLYHPSSIRMMGKVTPGLVNEAKKVTKMLKDGGVKEVFFGDIHYFTRYFDPETGLGMTTMGAIAAQRNTQNPRFGIVTVYEDGSYQVEDVEIK